jgi:hypothetical protein
MSERNKDERQRALSLIQFGGNPYPVYSTV